ncbi:MAG TPA: creatininase family protein [Candidatus Acidoferrum sp.]|nr:creatininase family protein [Candidatus Acidoferrum sp.]
MKKIRVIAFLLLLVAIPAFGQTKLSTKWEELTAEDFRTAIQQSKGTCLLPFGILEKHGPHLPLGTDLLNVRYAALHAAEQEFAVVFPEYYFGQIFEAKHEPGTVAYSVDLQLKLLQETTDEMARNGCKKVVIVNGHGGNEHLLPFFAQAQMASPKDYVVYVLGGERSRPGGPAKKSTGIDYHAGENETSNTLYTHTHPPGPGETRVRRRPEASESAGISLYRHLVVRALPRALFRRRLGGREGTWGVERAGMDFDDCRSYPRGEGR